MLQSIMLSCSVGVVRRQGSMRRHASRMLAQALREFSANRNQLDVLYQQESAAQHALPDMMQT